MKEIYLPGTILRLKIIIIRSFIIEIYFLHVNKFTILLVCSALNLSLSEYHMVEVRHYRQLFIISVHLVHFHFPLSDLS